MSRASCAYQRVKLRALGRSPVVQFDLARTYTRRGMTTTIALSLPAEPSRSAQGLLSRCAQEALRNARVPR